MPVFFSHQRHDVVGFFGDADVWFECGDRASDEQLLWRHQNFSGGVLVRGRGCELPDDAFCFFWGHFFVFAVSEQHPVGGEHRGGRRLVAGFFFVFFSAAGLVPEQHLGFPVDVAGARFHAFEFAFAARLHSYELDRGAALFLRAFFDDVDFVLVARDREVAGGGVDRDAARVEQSFFRTFALALEFFSGELRLRAFLLAGVPAQQFFRRLVVFEGVERAGCRHFVVERELFFVFFRFGRFAAFVYEQDVDSVATRVNREHRVYAFAAEFARFFGPFWAFEADAGLLFAFIEAL